MAKSFIYKLKTPIEMGSETITEIEIGDIKGKHMRNLPGDPKLYNMGVIMELASKVTKQPGAVLDEMDCEDLLEVCGIVGERLGAGQKIGGAS